MSYLCCDQPQTLTQGYYSRVDLLAINAAPPVDETYKTVVVVDVPRAPQWAGRMVGFS